MVHMILVRVMIDGSCSQNSRSHPEFSGSTLSSEFRCTDVSKYLTSIGPSICIHTILERINTISFFKDYSKLSTRS